MPRKTPAPPTDGAQVAIASMRPRPDAAENPRRQPAPRRVCSSFNEAAARCRGKRWPRACRTGRRRGFNEAAARCRGKPENHLMCAAATRASMRPRPDAAENVAAHRSPRRRLPASMRPRPDAAENGLSGRVPLPEAHSFNEAAARCRGKRSRGSRCPGRSRSFNEAAARCRGKPCRSRTRWARRPTLQ